MSQELHDERISAYLDGELAPGERAEVEELLRTSDAYQQALAELSALRESIKSLPRYSLGNDFADRVVAAARRSASKSSAAIPSAGAADVTLKTRKNQSAIPLTRPERRWLLSALGGLTATAACVALIFYALSDSGENVAKVEADGGNKEKSQVVIEEPTASEFVRAIASSKENEAVVVRVRLTKEAIRNKLLDEALQANGIAVAQPNLSNDAARETGKAYKDLVQSQATTSAAKRNAGDVLFVEADIVSLEKALSRLEHNPTAKAAFAPEAIIASIGKGPTFAPKEEGEPGSEIPGAASKIPTGGYAQHLPPRGFTLAPAATPPAASAAEKVPSRKSARVLIVVEVVE